MTLKEHGGEHVAEFKKELDHSQQRIYIMPDGCLVSVITNLVGTYGEKHTVPEKQQSARADLLAVGYTEVDDLFGDL